MASLGSSPDSSGTSPTFRALLNGTSIPRHLTRIPKDQQALLEPTCDDSWSGPIKDGRSGRANVPPQVLQQLQDFHSAHTLPPPAQKPKPLVSSGPSPTASGVPTAIDDDKSEDGDRSDASSDAPGTPISWSSSPERPHHLANQDSPSSASIKSQIEVESQALSPTFRSQLAPADTPSSPQEQSSPIRPAPKRRSPIAAVPRPDPKRRRIDQFPSSSAGIEEELETAIPGALDQATPPMNRMAARLMTAAEAVTSPPCGQGSMIPSTYNDVNAPAKPSTPNKRRPMKVIKFSESPESPPRELAADSTPHTTPAQHPTIPFSQPRENPPTSSGSLVTLTSLHAPQVVQDTPSVARSFTNDHPAGTAPTGHKGKAMAKRSVGSEVPESAPVLGELDFDKDSGPGLSNDEIRRHTAIGLLDDEWDAEDTEWLPLDLQHLKPTLSTRSLETLKNLTELAVRNGVKLAKLWSRPDGCLYRAASKQYNGRLVFPEDLISESLDFFGAEVSRQAKESVKAAGVSAQPPLPEVGSRANTNVTVVAGGESNLAAASRPSREKIAEHFTRQPLEAFRAAYPSYSASVGDFVKACLAVKDLHRKRALPKWLYDDFIRSWVDGYIPYIESLHEDERADSAIEWYVDRVEQPVFTLGIVTAENLDQVFKVYRDEVESTRKSLSQSASPTAPTAKKALVETVEIAVKDEPAENRAASPPESATTPAQRPGPQAGHLPDGLQITLETGKGHVDAQEKTPEPGHGDHFGEPSPALTSRQKGKQRAIDQQPQNMHSAAAASASVAQLQSEVKDEDEDVVFISSLPRPPSARSNAPALELGTTHEVRNTLSSSSRTQATPQRPLRGTQVNVPVTQTQRVGTVAETPPPPAAALLASTPRSSAASRLEGMRRPLNFGPPSGPPPSSPAKSVLSASTQGSRVKKGKKSAKDRERENEKYKARIMKMQREGRLPAPPQLRHNS